MQTLVFLVQLLPLLFHQVTTLFNFYPFNNVRGYSPKERLLACGVNGVVMAAAPTGFAFGIAWLKAASLWIYPALLLSEFLTWWKPYFFEAGAAWQETYDRIFSQTVQVLPPRKNHPAPNLEHLVLHGLTLAAAVVTFISYFAQP